MQKKIEVDDFEFRLQILDCRKPSLNARKAIVLLHGFGGQMNDWYEVGQKLSEEYTVLIPSLSSLLLGPECLLFSEQVRKLESLMSFLRQDFEDVHLAGASYGGALSWALRAKCPWLIKSIVMINPMPPNPIQRMRSPRLRKLVKMGRYPLVLAMYLKSPFGRKSLLQLATNIRRDWSKHVGRFNLIFSKKERMINSVIHRFSRILSEENWDYWENEIKKPGASCLLIHGLEDRLFGAEQARWMRDQIDNCEMMTLMNVSHMAIRSNPQKVVDAILAFNIISQPDLSAEIGRPATP